MDTSEEVEALKAMFCLPGECEIIEGSNQDIYITLNLKAEDHSKMNLQVKFILRKFYPSVSPKIALSSSNLSGKVLNEFRQRLQEIVHKNIGSRVLLDLICFLNDKLNQMAKDSDNNTPTGALDVPNVSFMLLHIDHMRAQTQYVKYIKKWTTELNLKGRLLFFKRLILILLEGDISNLKEYVIRNRTVNVDVDSRGQSCKERMLSVMCEQTLSKSVHKFDEFNIINCETEKAVREIFTGDILRQIYQDYVVHLSGYGLR